jgi:hypothetical protein
LGGLVLVAMFLALSLEGASLEVFPNQFARKKMKNFQKHKPKNVKHKRIRTNENVTHVKS